MHYGSFVFKRMLKGAENGIGLCLSTLVPSLFPFMVLASYITEAVLQKKSADIFHG